MDELDRKLVHALHVDGRIAFTAVAAALGVSDQTVARRYRALRSSGALRVLGLTNARRRGEVEWLVRLRCVPGAGEPLAAALAARPDTAWVNLTSGGTEIVCFTRSPAGQATEGLLGRLPRAPRVTEVTAHCLLRTFVGGPTGWHLRTSALTAAELAALPAPEPVAPSAASEGPGPLGAADEALLATLAADGRAGYRELAAATGWSESTAQRRVEQLRRSGTLFFDVDVDPERLGVRCEAMLWLSVPPARLAEVGATLAAHPEVAFAAATTGPANLAAIVGCADVDALYDYVAGRLGAVTVITHLETAPVVRSVKRAGTLV